MPAAEAQQAVEAERWQYDTAVQQAVHRRNLHRSRAEPPEPTPREAWVEASAAARAVEERLAYNVPPRSSAEGAATRGRFAGTAQGKRELTQLEAGRRAAEAAARREHVMDLRVATSEALGRHETIAREALAGWQRIQRQNEMLQGMTPGEAAAAARRRY